MRATVRSRTVFEIARIKAFLNLETGVTRSEVLKPGHLDTQPQRNRIRAENVVWIFGFGRSGSTWLSLMMADIRGPLVWQEPGVGALFGSFYFEHPLIVDAHRKNPLFILGSQREIWIKLIRSFFLDGAAAMFPKAKDENVLVVKEPYGSIGAPLLMEALPESRMILLVREPRDVVASALDAYRVGSWGYSWLGSQFQIGTAEEWATLYLRTVSNAKKAYDAHAGRKVVVKYEELKADALSTLKHIYSTLEIPVTEGELIRAVEKHSWENIPEKEKGEGKFYRKASTGGWKEDLTAEQAETVERITAPILKEFYGFGA